MTRVKICGLTHKEDALYASQAGADMLGFIFAEVSQRYIRPEHARPIIEQVKSTYPHIYCIGVFVINPDTSAAEIDTACSAAGVDAAQVVGEFPASFWDDLKYPAYVTIRPASHNNVRQLSKRFERREQADFLPTLQLDAFHPNLYGGTGESTSLDIMKTVAAHSQRLMLSGGLNPNNVGKFVQHVQPWAVDVASGTEASPGKKDPLKVRRFIQAAQKPSTAKE